MRNVVNGKRNIPVVSFIAKAGATCEVCEQELHKVEISCDLS